MIASRQTSALFSDKEQVWADNAASSPFFGNVYVCYAAFRGNGNGFTNQPLDVLTSRDGGDSWTQHQVTPATNNTHSRNGFGRSGCTVRTDSHGVVYVFDFQFGFSPTTAAAGQIQMIRSLDGGAHWQRPVNIFTAFDTCNAFEPSIGRCVEDGVGGARSDLSPAPSVDIANGAPSGADASDRLVLSWVDGRDGLNHEHVMFSTSTNGGEPVDGAAPGRARRRSRLLLGARDLARRHRRVARVQRLRGAVQGQRDRSRQRPAVDRPGPARRRSARVAWAPSPPRTAGRPATRAARRRTISPPSSSATTSTPPRRGPMA